MSKIKEIKSLDHLDMMARKIVEGFLIGLHRSPFHGFSSEFREHKQYNIGDNLRDIDYKVYARTDKMFIKKYDEETNLNCQMILDVSNSMKYPTDTEKSKLDFSIVSIASLINLLKKQRDAFGLTTFSDDILEIIPPKLSEKNKQLIYKSLNQYISNPPEFNQSNIADSLQKICYSLKNRSVVILFTDFFESIKDEEELEKLFKSLKNILFYNHELIIFHVMSNREEVELNFENRPMEFVDVESGEKIKINPHNYSKRYNEIVSSRIEAIQQRCISFGIDYNQVNIEDDYKHILSSFLRKRKKWK